MEANTVDAVFKSTDSIVLKSLLVRVVLKHGFYCSEGSIVLTHNQLGVEYLQN